MCVIAAAALSVWLITSRRVFFRIDMTEEGRFTIAECTREIVSAIDEPVHIDVYLGGDIDANMVRLRHAVRDLIDEFNAYAGEKITVAYIDPNDAPDEESRYAGYERLERRGLRGMSVAVRDAHGGVSQQVVFPWAEVSAHGDTVPVCLLQPGMEASGEAAVNAAMEDHEYLFADAIRILQQRDVRKIAFIEGHGELSEAETYDISAALSRYFQVDRGVLGTEDNVLDGYDAVIVASPQEKFTETEKYIIDQYVMGGGRVLWCIDGVKVSHDRMAESGVSPLMPLDLNLQDMLFRYGVRITPTVVEDLQCAYMPVNIARPGETPKFEPMPWFYAPLLQTSPYHPITKNRSAVKGEFASVIDFPGDTAGVKKSVLLVSGNATHITAAPNDIDLNRIMSVDPQEYFTTGYAPVAAVMEGRFVSAFKNRMPPQGLNVTKAKTDSSVETRMVVVGDGDVLRNDLENADGGVAIVPLGYDRMTRMTYGNKDFIISALLYLTDDIGLMELRNRTVRLRLLNKAAVMTEAQTMRWVNVLLPLAIVAAGGAAYLYLHRRRWVR